MSILNDIKTLFQKKKAPITPIPTPKPLPKKVLIVEDEPVLLEMYYDKFTHEGYTVIRAKNGQEGLDMAVAENPDTVLLDLMMPVMDGISMLSRLRKIPQFKYLPVIVLTNAGQIENIRETQRYNNAAEFMIKSNVSLEDIVAKVKEYAG